MAKKAAYRESKDPVYARRVRLFTCSYDDFYAAMGEKPDDDYRGAYGLCTTYDDPSDGRKVVAVWIEEESQDQLHIVIHELYHAMKAVMNITGVEDEEAEAYYLDYLVREFLE